MNVRETHQAFDVVVRTIQIMITMFAWLLVGLVGAVVVAFLRVGIEWVFLTPVVALGCGWLNCLLMISYERNAGH